jgi:hypothetical protein
MSELAGSVARATRLRELALSATGWAGRWDCRADRLASSWWGEALTPEVRSRLAWLDSAARTAQVVCEARLARAAKMAG